MPGAGIVDCRLDALAVNAQRAARKPKLGELNCCGPTAEALADAQRAAIKAACGQVLAERSGINGEAHGLDLVESFGCNQQDGAPGDAVKLRMPPAVACDSAECEMAAIDFMIRDASGGNAHLDDDARHVPIFVVTSPLR